MIYVNESEYIRKPVEWVQHEEQFRYLILSPLLSDVKHTDS
jgi:hypothetical protein